MRKNKLLKNVELASKLVLKEDKKLFEELGKDLPLDMKIDNEEDIDNESPVCLECSGYPLEGCISYTNLDHIIDFYRNMRGEIR